MMVSRASIRFVAAFVIAMVATAGAVVALNRVVADAGAPPPLAGCEISRADDNSTQYAKLSGLVARGGTNVLLLGTSRTKFGWGPEVREILGPTTNAALMHSSFETMRVMLAHWPGKPGDRVIIEASFGLERRNGLEHWTSPPNPSAKLKGELDPRPIVTGVLNLEGRERMRTDCRGFPILPLRPAKAEHFDRIARFWANAQLAGHKHIDPHGADGLRELILDALDRGYRVDVWMPPVHACMVEVGHRAGYATQKERWIRTVAGMSALSPREGGPVPPVAVWDFSGYSAITMEPLPKRNSNWRSQYFSDPGHMMQSVGMVAARQMTGQPVSADEAGTRIDPATVEAYLVAQRQLREAYLAKEPAAATRCTLDAAPDGNA